METAREEVSIFDRVESVYIDVAEKAISSQQEYELMGEYERKCKALDKELEAMRKEEARPWDEGKQAVQDKFKPYLAKLKQTIDIINDERKKWFRAEEARRQAEQRRLEEEARRKEEEERKKLLNQAVKADAKGETEKAEELLEKAEQVHIQTPIVPTKVEQNVGQTMIPVWRARIVDIKKIPQEYLAAWIKPVDIQGPANKFAAATKGSIQINGIEFYEDLIPRTRT